MQSSLAWIPLFSLLLCDQAAPQLLDPSCSRTRAEDRIMYGDDASKSDAIYMAAIYNRTHFQCGGTLINRRYVLTAAHCLESRYVLFVHLGAHNRAEPTAWYDVSFGVQHISYNPINKQNDIGLIKLKRRVEYNGRIRPICIYLDKAIKSQVAMVKTFDAFGWGLNEHGQQSDILQTITLNQLNREECRWLGETLSSTQICAGVPGADTCRGDSGGPLSKKIEINKQTFVAQFGIISYGSLTCDSMAVYTDVTSFVDWIQETISRFDDPPEIPPNFQRVPTAPPSVVEKLWLYDDCGGDGENMSSIVQLTIYGPGFKAQGVLITDQFVITVARDLPENAASLEVSIMGSTNYAEYRVSLVFRHEDDLALLKLMLPLDFEGQKPICIVSETYQKQVERIQTFAIFDNVKSKEFSAKPWNSQMCSTYVGTELDQNQLCVENPPGMSQTNEISGDILVNKIMVSAKQYIVLLGVISFSTEDIQILTNVMTHTKWIASKINLN